MVNINRLKIIKIITLVILFLTFLQYLYLYPVKLNFSAITKSPISLSYNSNLNFISSPNHLEHSLFNFKTGSKAYKRSPFSKELSNEDLTLALVASKEDDSSRARVTKNGDLTLLNGKVSLSSSSSVKSISLNSTENNEIILPLCATRPSTLLGLTKVTLDAPPSLASLGRIHSDLTLGGHFKPPNCRSKDKVAIIVPFRDREEHLRTFLFNLIPTLKRQQIEFNIFVIEQGGSTKDEAFNRAMLFNVGFVEANKREEYDCFIFHDVDLIPENDYNLYNCPVQPRHMSVAVDKMKYRLPYRTLFGGISALTREHFLKINGFSNSFWGWGGEDDDMAGRIAYNGLYISRPPPNIARYKMLKHKHQKLNNQRYRILQKGKTRFKTDGLSNLKYTVEQITLENTYTLVRVQLGKAV